MWWFNPLSEPNICWQLPQVLKSYRYVFLVCIQEFLALCKFHYCNKLWTFWELECNPYMCCASNYTSTAIKMGNFVWFGFQTTWCEVFDHTELPYSKKLTTYVLHFIVEVPSLHLVEYMLSRKVGRGTPKMMPHLPLSIEIPNVLISGFQTTFKKDLTCIKKAQL